MQAIDNNPQDRTKVTLLFANKSERDILLKKEFDGASCLPYIPVFQARHDAQISSSESLISSRSAFSLPPCLSSAETEAGRLLPRQVGQQGP
jgi:hypothetical protein